MLEDGRVLAALGKRFQAGSMFLPIDGLRKPGPKRPMNKLALSDNLNPAESSIGSTAAHSKGFQQQVSEQVLLKLGWCTSEPKIRNAPKRHPWLKQIKAKLHLRLVVAVLFGFLFLVRLQHHL